MNDLKVVDPNTHECVCAKRYFLNITNGKCFPCPYDCMTCSQADKCDTCDNNLFQTKRTKNYRGRCVCPSSGFYDNIIKEDIVCQKCHSSCKACYGPRSHDCLTCDIDK